ncbi:glycosyltransferase family 4 protein [Acidicapsa ligni]|uniref:glycosyltransferase family 4 protein n=1 Tax=Acidicapsa ligni TaxID=542300 RepID=UPI0021E06835|nr:glycosyltransferase family 1 protein [Acidicapsa ligni]
MVDEEFTVNTGRNIRVGFVLPAGHWLGGKNYLRNLFGALHALPGNTISPVIFTGRRQVDASADFPGIEIVASSILDRKSPGWIARKSIQVSTSRDILLQRLLLRHGVSILSHSFHLGKTASIKTIGWIPDFQHVHLPEFFLPKERAYRDREYLSIGSGCDRVVVSSECARADLFSFSPEYGHKAELLRFVANPVPLTGAAPLPELQKIYGFEGPYFLLPNQFWAHKNHRVVIGALGMLKRQGRPFLVLATGSTGDYRNPTFYSSLMQYAAECDVLDCFRVLGQVPYEHLAGLMQHAIAFVNPSRFEGWSTSVEEAKSMGKQIVLSDIPVHREQAPARSFFFLPTDPDGLAQAMQAAYNQYDHQQDAAMQDEARSRFPERQQEFAKTYQAIISRVAGEKPPSL